MNRKVRSAIIRILFISGLSLIPLLVSCGKSIENAQDFVPNDPPVIESCTVTDNATGKEVDASNIILGMTLKCVVKAVDPEGKPLAYTFTSDYLSCSSQTSTADGCDGLFVVTRVVANTPVTLTVAVRDQKEASATKLIPIGTGKEGPLLTLGSPSPASINNIGSTTFSFNCSSDGWYQVLESSDDVAKNPAAHMSTSAKYTAGEEKTATVVGPSFSGAFDTNKVQVSSGAGVKKIWIIFKDNNNYYTASSVSVSLTGFAVTYMRNILSGTLEGTIPVDNNGYLQGGSYTVAHFPGNGSVGHASIINAEGVSYRFSGWSESPSGGTIINAGESKTMGSSNVVLYAQWTAYAVGDIGPAGGRIFQVNPVYSSGHRYLEVEDRVDNYGEDRPYSLASDYCTLHTQNGYHDWSLPTLTELNCLYSTRRDSNAGLTDNFQYWSTTADVLHPGTHIAVKFQSSGDYASFYDSTPNWSRAIRRF